MAPFPAVLDSVGDLGRDRVESLFLRAAAFKGLPPSPRRARGTVCALFLEPSTRTRLSFAVAAGRLGLGFLDVGPESSSFRKGEGMEGALRALAGLGVDLCVVRSPEAGVLAPFREDPPLALVNGGDGAREHPTQALGDLLAMRECGFAAEGGTVAVVGDSRHSRVARSLCALLPLFGAKTLLCGPPGLVDPDPPPGAEAVPDLEAAVRRAGAVYLLRVQRERHAGGGAPPGDRGRDRAYHEEWGLDAGRLSRWNPEAHVFHPGPANVGVEVSEDLTRSPRWRGDLQVSCGVLARTALLSVMLGKKA